MFRDHCIGFKRGSGGDTEAVAESLCFLQMALSAVIGGEAPRLMYRGGLQKAMHERVRLNEQKEGSAALRESVVCAILDRYTVRCSYPAEASKGTSVMPAGCRGCSWLSFPRYISAGQRRLIVFLARRWSGHTGAGVKWRRTCAVK